MEVRLTRSGASLPEVPPMEGYGCRAATVPRKPELFLPQEPAPEPVTAAPEPKLDKEALKELLRRTTELVTLVAPQRHLKYEVIDEAEMVQVQVIDTTDGNIVRKIPTDAIVSLVREIRRTLSDRTDVRA